MLALTFQVGGEVYGVDCRRVVEVVPRVDLRPVPHASLELAGLAHYRGKIVPVLDVSRLLGGPAVAERLDTRVILVTCGAEGPLVGLLAERASELRRLPDAIGTMGIPQAPYLGPVLDAGDRLVQLLMVERLAGTIAAMLTARAY